MIENESPKHPEGGTLYLVASPIGNLADISYRAVEVLQHVDLIACEDTRHSAKLLKHYQVDKPKIAYHEHNEQAQTEHLIERLKKGVAVALLSDAGTPNLSDPGFRLVRACQKQEVKVVPIPGPAACICAITASGLPTNQFLYAGFLPPKKSARQKFLSKHKDCEFSLVLYESRYRILKCLEDILFVLGRERVVSVAKEVTKKHETIYSGPAGQVYEKFHQSSQPKGEFVIVIAPDRFQL